MDNFCLHCDSVQKLFQFCCLESSEVKVFLMSSPSASIFWLCPQPCIIFSYSSFCPRNQPEGLMDLGLTFEVFTKIQY